MGKKSAKQYAEKNLIQVRVGIVLILTVTFQNCSGTSLATVLPPNKDLQILKKLLRKYIFIVQNYRK